MQASFKIKRRMIILFHMLSFNEVKPKQDKNGELVVIASCKYTTLRLVEVKQCQLNTSIKEVIVFAENM